MDIKRHGELTNELANALRVLGDTRSAVVKASRDVFMQTSGLGITERREAIRHATADLAALVAEQEGEVEALRVELRHIELDT